MNHPSLNQLAQNFAKALNATDQAAFKTLLQLAVSNVGQELDERGEAGIHEDPALVARYNELEQFTEDFEDAAGSIDQQS